MPFIPHIRLTARFTLGAAGAPKETASCTLNFARGAANWNDEAQREAAVEDCFGDWSAFVALVPSRFHTSTCLDECRLYVIGANGNIEENATYPDGVPPAISIGDPMRGPLSPTAEGHPWQCSMVTTLVAGTRGKGRFGRIYLPPMSYNMQNDGLMNSGIHAELLTAVHGLLDNLSNKPGIDAGWGLRVAGSTGSGTLREVTEVRLGHVPDTQRRRRRSLEESYASVPFDA